ncbi:hypothetical protein HCA55_04915 [Listeria booriae]|uniref:Bacterial Ig domain-containing protein n=1 Tax=Listeria booriae TaxID=1552123 RepID=A0A842AWD0_9LIST|nr:Ig-like domain-containing protein [Listeria booriae]MBC1796056.1 hypothetical protein [Listeria booriae]MBC1800323.1 hypothetical protein [Listeria booriae]MBC1812892.1 hypothetical protein [Listeria booriae]
MKGTKKIVAFAVITGLIVAPYGGLTSQLAKTPFGSIIAHAATQSEDVTNLSPILTNTTKVTGKATPGRNVYVLSQIFTEGWSVADANGNFEITIGRQDVGKALNIVTSFLNSGVARTVELEKPTANPVLDGAWRITGNAYKGSNITVTVGGLEIGRTTAYLNYTGDWRMDIVDPSKLTVGSVLQVKSQVGARVTTSDYTIGMSNPIPNTVTMDTTRVSGKGVAGATVRVSVAGREIGTGQVDSNGNLGATIPKQAVGTKLLLTQTKNGQTNAPVEVTVKNKLDSVTDISFITTDSTSLTGKGIPRTTVQVKAGTNVIGTAQVNDAGSFMVTIPKQVVNTKLAITQTQGTDTSDAVEANVVELYAGTPTLEEFYYSSTSSNFIKGTVPIGTTWVRLMVNGKFIDDFWRGDKRTVTPFSIDVSNVPELRETGATFTVTGIDRYYRYSEVTTGVVESALTPVVYPYRAGQAYIRGTVGPEAASISVYTRAGVLIRNGQINNDRTFSIYVSGASDLQLAGNKVMVRATTADGKVSSSTELTVLP